MTDQTDRRTDGRRTNSHYSEEDNITLPGRFYVMSGSVET